MKANNHNIDTNIDITPYKFFNEPVKCTLEDYNMAKNEFVKHISKDCGVISIFQIGNVGVYGISDLDFIVVLDENIEFTQKHFSIENFSKKTKYVLFHEPFIVNRNAIKNIYQITSIFDISHIYGKHFEINKLNENDLKYNTLVLLNDICIVSLCHEYLNYTKSKKIDVRLLLARLNSLKYPIQMLSTLTSTQFAEFDYFTYNFRIFRENWFVLNDIERKQKLIYFLHLASEISQKLTKLILEYNLSQHIFECVPIENSKCMGFFDGEGTKINFTNHVALNDNSNYHQNLDIFWGLHLKEYAEEAGAISDYIDSHLSISQAYKSKNNVYQKLQRERILLLNDLAEFRDSINISFGGIFTFGYKKTNLISTIVKMFMGRIHLLKENYL